MPSDVFMDLPVLKCHSSNLYSALPETREVKHIRVLELFPGAFSEELRGRLVCVELRKARYQALSYTWGTRSMGRHITLNELHYISITDNLYDALQRLREHKVRTLWVDSVCIDQQHVKERSAQVSIMGDIYRQADAVDVWLGEPGPVPRIDKSLLCCPEITECMPQVVIREMDRKFKSTRRQIILDDRNFFSFFVCGDAQRFEQALRITRPSWHDRGWVVQEFVLARRVYVCAGSARVFWQASEDSFAAIEPIVHSFPRRYPRLKEFMRRIWQFSECVPWFQPQGATLYQTYKLLRTTETTDPRDKIYSLVGILQKSEAVHIAEVDYSATVANVFARATCAFLTTAPTHACVGGSNSLRSFNAFALVIVKGERTSGLPSWCIDFCRLHAVSESVDNRALLFSCAKQSRSNKSPAYSPRVVDDKLTVKLSGFIPDYVVDICQHTLFSGSENNSIEEQICTFDRAEILNYAYQIVVFARKSATRLKCWSDLDTRNYVCHTLGLRYGPKQLFELKSSSLFTYRNDELVHYDESCPYSLKKHSLTELLKIYARASGAWHKEGGLYEFLEYCRCAGSRATLFATSRGLLGIAPSSIESDDILVAQPYSRVALLLRPDHHTHTFHGLVFLSGYGVLWGRSRQRSQSRHFVLS